jgi:hypothetical protein
VSVHANPRAKSPARKAESESEVLLPETSESGNQRDRSDDSARPQRTGFSWLVFEIVGAIVTALLSIVIATLALHISPAGLNERWQIGGADGILHYFVFTGATQSFSYVNNPNVGFPDGVNFFFSTQVDFASAVTMSVLTLFIHNGITLLNVFFLLTFGFAGFTAFLFFRALRVRAWIAVLFGLAFALAPYHFLRIGYGHAFIANCGAIPLIGIVVLMVAGRGADPFRAWAERASSRRARMVRLFGPPVVLGVVIATTTPYYFIFGVLVVAGVWLYAALATLLRKDKLSTLRRPTVAFAALSAFVGISLFLFSRSYGERYATYFARAIGESETYAGKFASLILPWFGSGLPKARGLALFYQNNSTVLPSTEAPGSSLIASLGIVALIAVLLVLGIADSRRLTSSWLGRLISDDRTRALAVGTVWALLFFMVSGLGIFVAMFVDTDIRAWSRMSIVLILFGLAFVALLVNAATAKYGVRYILGAVVGAVVVFDQLAGVAQALPVQPTADTEVTNFVAAADAALPDGCGVIQLPIKSFPESGSIGAMGDYDEGLPFLYTQPGHIRWSYGSINGTLGWNALAGATTPATFSSAVTASGACAIEVDLDAYTQNVDGWKPLVAAATGEADPTPIVTSDSGKLLLFAVPTAAK